MQSVCHAYDDTFHVEVGETFTVYGESHTHIQAVLWDFDPALFETVSVSGYSTKGTFKAIKPSPSVGSVIQATIYYYKEGTTSSGVNKAVSSWKVYVADDGSDSTVSLPGSMNMDVDEVTTVRASTSNSNYSGGFLWESRDWSKVSIVSHNGNTATLRANSGGGTYIYVTLDNGNFDSMYVTVNEKEEFPTVTANPGSGTYEKGTKIYLNASMSNATIRYTTDGSTPTYSSREYYSALTLNESFTLKARAYNSSGAGGDVLTCRYTVEEPEKSALVYNIISYTDKTVEVVANDEGCEGNIVIPEKVTIDGTTYTVVRVGDYAFATNISHNGNHYDRGEKVTSIQLPNTLKEIGESAFFGCENITAISMPEAVTFIGDSAFSCCTKLSYLYLT